ncbi:unnamed protein product [Absidia cylindrospora]
MLLLCTLWLTLLLFVSSIQTQLALNSEQTSGLCDCGYRDDQNAWTDGWFMDFENNMSVNSNSARKTNSDPDMSLTSTTLLSLLQQDFFMANYEIAAKYENTYSRLFSNENVKIDNNALQLHVTVNNATSTQQQQSVMCGAIGTKRQDILYGSFRSQMRLSNVNGTVQAMYFFNPDGEIDIEVLGAVAPFQSYFAIHPGLQEPNGRASALTHDNHPLGFDPSSDFHEYRFDWYPNRADFYIDGQLAQSLTTNIPQKPGRFMFSHWTDGNAKFSKGPPTTNAIMEIKSIVAVFNTSVPAAAMNQSSSSSSTDGSCEKSQTSCSIPGIKKNEPSSTSSSLPSQSSQETEQSPTNQVESSPVSSSSIKSIQLKLYLVASLVMIASAAILV